MSQLLPLIQECQQALADLRPYTVIAGLRGLNELDTQLFLAAKLAEAGSPPELRQRIRLGQRDLMQLIGENVAPIGDDALVRLKKAMEAVLGELGLDPDWEATAM